MKKRITAFFIAFFIAINVTLTLNVFAATTEKSGDTNKYFYNQLTVSEKAFYDEFKKELLDTINLEPFTFNIPDNIDISANNTIDFQNIIIKSLNSLTLDYADAFWLSGISCLFNYSYNPVTSRITTVIFDFKFAEEKGYNNKETLNSYIKQTKEIIAKFDTSGANNYEKIVKIHNQLVKNTTYDLNSLYGDEIVGLFVYKSAVCEGYAEAFKLLCEKENIPCVSVLGEANGGLHMWNYVQMEDNKWYAVDVTWDDPLMNGTSDYPNGENLRYDYLLKGSDLFNKDHVPNGGFTALTGISFEFPELSPTDYILPEEPSVSPSDDGERQIGDVNDDNNVSTLDVLFILKHIAKIVEFNENDRFYADLNGDTDITTMDALIILKKLAGIL